MERRKFITGAIAAGTLVAGTSFCSCSNSCENKNNSLRKRVMREGHRGFCHMFPENTLLAFKEAIKAGVDRVELDLRLSADGELVIVVNKILSYW